MKSILYLSFSWSLIKLSEDSNSKKIQTLIKHLEKKLHFSKRLFKRTVYSYWSISGLSKRFIDLRYKVSADFNIGTFITFSCLFDPNGRTFANIFFSRFKMGDFTLWRLLERWFLLAAKNERVSRRLYFRTKVTHATHSTI